MLIALPCYANVSASILKPNQVLCNCGTFESWLHPGECHRDCSLARPWMRFLGNACRTCAEAEVETMEVPHWGMAQLGPQHSGCMSQWAPVLAMLACVVMASLPSH